VNCVEMALRMRQRVEEMQNHWKRLGVPQGINVRIGIATGYCTVGNFGSEQRLDYTALGGPVNLAARLQSISPTKEILIDESTWSLIHDRVECSFFEEFQPKGFSRPVKTYQVQEFVSSEHRDQRNRYSRLGDHVEVNVIDSSDMRAAVAELRQIQEDLERQIRDVESNE
jgi:adenylate cyclase